LASDLAVTNISYLLTEANYVGGFSGRDLVIVDEADTLESQLMGFVEYRVPVKYMNMARMSPPKKGARKTTIIQWMKDFVDTFEPMAKAEMDYRQQRGMLACVQSTLRVQQELERELKLRDNPDLDEDSGLWLRQYESKDETFIMKPVKVSSMGTKYLWRHAPKWLVMSATLISSDEMADSLGLPYDYSTVLVPSTFPPENRPIVMAPVADMSFKSMKDGDGIDDVCYAIQAICLQHPHDRTLIHTVSYNLTEQIAYQLRRGKFRLPGREIITYNEGRDRHSALDQFKRTKGAILLAPSMQRGIDLPDDMCRVQIIAKVPFPSLMDRQISARMRMGQEGSVWYAVKTIRDIVQMAGRAVRHKDDHCVTYIIDSQFATNLYRKHKSLFPVWFRDAIDTRRDIRWLRRPRVQ
jgi:Rad3-related DNA helicase